MMRSELYMKINHWLKFKKKCNDCALSMLFENGNRRREFHNNRPNNNKKKIYMRT